jgi:glycosyltransferase involved in cell wall biosynthesis
LVNTRKISVAHVIDRLNVGGAERIAVTLANIFHDNGHKVLFVTTVSKGPLASLLKKEIPLIDLERKWKWNPVIMYRLIQAVKRFDIVHVHSRHNLRYFLLAKTLFGLRKQIFYHEHHGYRVNTKATGLEKKLFPQTIFIAVSEQLKKWAVEQAGVAPDKVFVLPNIVLRENIALVKKEENIIKLVIVSNFVPVKNIAFAINILERLLLQGGKQYSLIIIGAKANENYFNEIVDLVKEKQLQQRVFFIHDCISVQSGLPQFDLALHTSLSESGPLVLIEYLAQGLSFITYETGEVVQQIKQEVPELIMQDFDVDEWVKRIAILLQKDKEVLQLQLQNLFEKYYSADAYYEACMQIYNTELSTKS